jgi:hypothetical protein
MSGNRCVFPHAAFPEEVESIQELRFNNVSEITNIDDDVLKRFKNLKVLWVSWLFLQL